MSTSDSTTLTIYVDTSFVVAATFEGLAYSDVCASFCDRLVADGSHVHFSQIVRLEFSQVLAKLPKDPLLPMELRASHELDRWDTSPSIREAWLAFGTSEFEELIARFARFSEVPFDLPIWRESLTIMARHRLRSHDAIHVATARSVGVRAVATLDTDFRRVPDLDVILLRETNP